MVYCTLAALPQWLGMLGVNILFSFLVRSSTIAAFLTLAVAWVPQNALKLIGLLLARPVLGKIAQWMPAAIVDNAQSFAGDGRFMAFSWLLGAAWFIGATIVGLILFRRKEIS